MKEIDLYSLCVNYWGMEKQFIKTQEECAEMIQAISKYLLHEPLAINKVIAEFIDLELMVGQMKYMLLTMMGRKNDYKVTRELTLEKIFKMLQLEPQEVEPDA